MWILSTPEADNFLLLRGLQEGDQEAVLDCSDFVAEVFQRNSLFHQIIFAYDKVPLTLQIISAMGNKCCLNTLTPVCASQVLPLPQSHRAKHMLF